LVTLVGGYMSKTTWMHDDIDLEQVFNCLIVMTKYTLSTSKSILFQKIIFG
jgi:hypothetical protein